MSHRPSQMGSFFHAQAWMFSASAAGALPPWFHRHGRPQSKRVETDTFNRRLQTLFWRLQKLFRTHLKNQSVLITVSLSIKGMWHYVIIVSVFTDNRIKSCCRFYQSNKIPQKSLNSQRLDDAKRGLKLLGFIFQRKFTWSGLLMGTVARWGGSGGGCGVGTGGDS